MAVSISFGLLAAALLTLLYVCPACLVGLTVVPCSQKTVGNGSNGRCGRQGPEALVNRSTKSRLTVKQLNWFPGNNLLEKRRMRRRRRLPARSCSRPWEMHHGRGTRAVDRLAGPWILHRAPSMILLRSPAVDRRLLPENAHRLSEELIESWPRLRQRIRYVQADIDL